MIQITFLAKEEEKGQRVTQGPQADRYAVQIIDGQGIMVFMHRKQ